MLNVLWEKFLKKANANYLSEGSSSSSLICVFVLCSVFEKKHKQFCGFSVDCACMHTFCTVYLRWATRASFSIVAELVGGGWSVRVTLYLPISVHYHHPACASLIRWLIRLANDWSSEKRNACSRIISSSINFANNMPPPPPHSHAHNYHLIN